ncbi:MAG: anti-sigma F factor [Bacillota bacterium]|nr:anti-sigma F factor [Bacillota bacterium]
MAEDKLNFENTVELSFSSIKENVAAARLLAASLSSQIGFTISDIEEIKVAVSEGVSNAIVHGYGEDPKSMVYMEFKVSPEYLTIRIEDKGCGISDIKRAMEPTFSTVSERMGLGFVFMQTFMDEFQVETAPGEGTILYMKKYTVAHED